MTNRANPAEERAARLAAALRANLHKRKAQARAGRAVSSDGAPSDNEAPSEEEARAPYQPDQ